MRYELLYRPTFSAVRVTLEPGQSVRAESGAMVSMSPTIELESSMEGGLGKAIGRLLAKNTFFQTRFTATSGPGEVVLAPAMLGDVLGVELQGVGYMVTSGCFLASDPDLAVETKVSGKAFFAGESVFLMRVSGYGSLLMASLGAIHPVELPVGQTYVVDTGHIVAFSETMNYQVRKVARSIWGSLTSGEGFVAVFEGPGTVYLQTRNPMAFAEWLAPMIPGRRDR